MKEPDEYYIAKCKIYCKGKEVVKVEIHQRPAVNAKNRWQ